MRIERIRSVNLTGLGDVDWIFPSGPVLFFSTDRNRQRMLGDLLLELFYDLETPLTSKAQSCKSLIEMWVTVEITGFHVCRQFTWQDAEQQRSSTLVIEDETGQEVSLPENMTLGEYLFRVKLQAFCQGGIVEWPEKKENDNFLRRIRNMRQGGDEELSLTKVRASIAGAQKKVNEQKESMALVKAEYDALRYEWEAAHRQQEEERLLQIEIKNLHEKEHILVERIDSAAKIQERLVLLRQNSDYRELRRLQGELARLEERCRETESDLTALTLESQVDWAMIESLHEECMEWASLQEHVKHIAAKAQIRAEKIDEMQNSLQISGYQGLSEDEDQRLRRAEEERDEAQVELDKLVIIKKEIEKIQIKSRAEVIRLQDFAALAEITETDEIKIEQRERHLARWQSSKLANLLDRVLQEKLGKTNISERLSFRLAQYYQKCKASNYKEFKSQLKEFRDQRQRVEQLQMELEQLQEKVSREEKLRRRVRSRNNILNRAFTAAKVADFPAWLNGWEDYRQKKRELTLWLDELHLELEQQQMEEKKLAGYVEQLREKLGNWEIIATDRDEVLAVVLKVASQLRMKEEAEREVSAYSQKFYDLLGDRDIEHLAKILEPLADLERETRLSNEERLAEMAAWHKEREETLRQLADAEQRFQNRRKFPALSVLEKKIGTVKRQWMAYENLNRALDDAQNLLETSWQEWQSKYGRALKEEMLWIFSRISSSPIQEKIAREGAEAKRNYFAHRMAIARLAIHDNTEAPFFFLGGEMNEGQSFWEEVFGYLHKLSLSRQVVLGTSNANLWQKLAASGWQRLVV